MSVQRKQDFRHVISALSRNTSSNSLINRERTDKLNFIRDDNRFCPPPPPPPPPPPYCTCFGSDTRRVNFLLVHFKVCFAMIGWCVETCLHNLTDKIWSIFRQSLLCRFLIFTSGDKRGLKQREKKRQINDALFNALLRNHLQFSKSNNDLQRNYTLLSQCDSLEHQGLLSLSINQSINQPVRAVTT